MEVTIIQSITQALAAVGLAFICIKLISFVRLWASLFVLPGVSLSKFGPKGSWAVVTGASDGIGKEFSTQLAARGFNLVLISRTASKLAALGAELKDKHGAQSKVLDMDFSQDLEDDYRRLETLIQGLDVSILINNVGQSHSIPVQFLETPDQEMLDIITINCIGTLKVTKLVAAGMVQRKRGLILTMASFGGILPTPLLATYSGSKAFLQQWSSALSSELKSSNIHVQLVQSYLVTSAMSKIRRASVFVPNPRAFVKSALGKIGRSGGAQGVIGTCSPYWSHGLIHWALATFTGTMNAFVVDWNRGMHEAIRKRALRKMEREKKKG